MSASPVIPDYTNMRGPELLSALGDNAHSWAVAFSQHAMQGGYPEMDIGFLTTWFANAIEHSDDVRHRRGQPVTRPVVGDI